MWVNAYHSNPSVLSHEVACTEYVILTITEHPVAPLGNGSCSERFDVICVSLWNSLFGFYDRYIRIVTFVFQSIIDRQCFYFLVNVKSQNMNICNALQCIILFWINADIHSCVELSNVWELINMETSDLSVLPQSLIINFDHKSWEVLDTSMLYMCYSKYSKYTNVRSHTINSLTMCWNYQLLVLNDKW